MPNINIDTSDPQYVQLLNGLGTLRTVLAPRISLLRQLRHQGKHAAVRAWLQRDPLMRRTLKLAQAFVDIIDEEVDE